MEFLDNSNKQNGDFLTTLYKYRADIAYVGTRYKGFQYQTNGDSIQAQLEKALCTLLRHPVSVRGSSRTDSGVHAEQQVVSFQSHVPLQDSDWRYSLNCLLPNDICIRQIAEVSTDFDPINDSNGKVYRYRLWRGQCTLPHLRGFVWSVPRDIDLNCLSKQVSDFEGLHDFTSFCSIDSDASTKVREVFEVKVDVREPLIDIWVCGGGFLKQMVRIMVGTLVDIGSGKMESGSIPKILHAQQRVLAGQTAPPQGLTLVNILYDDRRPLDSVIEEASRGYCITV
jgi:tRNA pseudouridine38-40 synthase